MNYKVLLVNINTVKTLVLHLERNYIYYVCHCFVLYILIIFSVACILLFYLSISIWWEGLHFPTGLTSVSRYSFHLRLWVCFCSFNCYCGLVIISSFSNSLWPKAVCKHYFSHFYVLVARCTRYYFKSADWQQHGIYSNQSH